MGVPAVAGALVGILPSGAVATKEGVLAAGVPATVWVLLPDPQAVEARTAMSKPMLNARLFTAVRIRPRPEFSKG